MESGQDDISPSIDIAEAAVDLCKKVGEEVAKQDFNRANKLIYKATRVFIYSSGYVCGKARTAPRYQPNCGGYRLASTSSFY